MKTSSDRKKDDQKEALRLKEKVEEIKQVKQMIIQATKKVEKVKELTLLDDVDSCLIITKLYYDKGVERMDFDHRGGDHKSRTCWNGKSTKKKLIGRANLILKQDIATLNTLPKDELFLFFSEFLDVGRNALYRRLKIGRGILTFTLDLKTILEFKKGYVSQKEVLKRLSNAEQEVFLFCKRCKHARLSPCPYCHQPILQCKKNHVLSLYKPTRIICEDFED